MDFLKSSRFIILIACIVGATFVDAGFRDATTVHDCLQELKEEAMRGGLPCKLMPDYARCAVRTSGLLKSLTSTAVIQQSQNAMEMALRTAGLDCPIDLFSIVNELRAEGYTGESTRDPNQPLTFETANSVEECVEAVGKSTVSCRKVPDFVKCNVRTEGVLDFLTTSGAIENFEVKMKEVLRNLGIYCDIDMHKIIKELKQESKTDVQGVHVASVDSVPTYGGYQNHGGPIYKVHHSYYQRNDGGSTIMKGMNLGIMTVFAVISVFIVYVR